MKVLYDLNILLDVFLDREPWIDVSSAAVQLIFDGKVIGYVSAISITTLFYIARKTVGSEQAMLTVARCLAVFEIAAVDQNVLRVASSIAGGDFEDHVQLASGQAAGVDAVVTRDATGFSGTPFRIFSPESLVHSISESI